MAECWKPVVNCPPLTANCSHRNAKIVRGDFKVGAVLNQVLKAELLR
jgi:hypothetical protein